MIYNCIGRPELACLGIERVWSIVKRYYRTAIDREKALNRQFNHIGLIQSTLGIITDEIAMKMAKLS